MEKKPVHRAIRLEESIAALCDIEQMFLQVENTDVFQAFAAKQKTQYYDTLSKLRELIQDLSNDTSREQLAS
jgi:hypothetical protein